MRTSEINRKTNETDISLKLNIDGVGTNKIKTGCGFLDHMLILFSRHARFDLEVVCDGDTYVDYHHTVEDIGIVLGKAMAECLGEMRGIKRYGSFILPMDESLILSAVDISGKSYLGYKLNIPTQRVGDFDTELVREFFEAFVRNANITLHINQLEGYNSHHIIEGAFKALARAIRAAAAVDPDAAGEIPSTKGTL